MSLGEAVPKLQENAFLGFSLQEIMKDQELLCILGYPCTEKLPLYP
jgi:hypothetical protein